MLSCRCPSRGSLAWKLRGFSVCVRRLDTSRLALLGTCFSEVFLRNSGLNLHASRDRILGLLRFAGVVHYTEAYGHGPRFRIAGLPLSGAPGLEALGLSVCVRRLDPSKQAPLDSQGSAVS